MLICALSETSAKSEVLIRSVCDLVQDLTHGTRSTKRSHDEVVLKFALKTELLSELVSRMCMGDGKSTEDEITTVTSATHSRHASSDSAWPEQRHANALSDPPIATSEQICLKDVRISCPRRIRIYSNDSRWIRRSSNVHLKCLSRFYPVGNDYQQPLSVFVSGERGNVSVVRYAVAIFRTDE